MIMLPHLSAPVCGPGATYYVKSAGITTTFKNVEATFVTNELRENRWSHRKAARERCIHETILFCKIRSLCLEIPKD